MIALAPTLALLLSPWVVQDTAAGLPEAEPLLGRARAQLGDVAKLDEPRVTRLRGKASWVGLQSTGRVTEVYGGLDRARINSEFATFGKFEQGTDGKVAWEKSSLDIKIRASWDGCEYIRRYGLAQHVDWRRMYDSALTVGLVEDDGVSCYRIELVPKMILPAPQGEEVVAPPPDIWLLDAETLLLRRAEAHAAGAPGETTLVGTVFDDWRTVDGIQYPFHTELTVSGFTLLVDYESIEHGVELPEDYFDLDEDVRMAIQDQTGNPRKPGTEIHMETLKARHLASVRVRCKHADLQKTLSVALPEALHYVTSSGGTLAGPPLVRYHDWGDELDLEAAMPVTQSVEGKGRVKPSTLPAGEAVIAWHVGPYDKLGETHEKLQTYVQEHGLEARSPCWEEYWTDPGMEPDPSKWRTKIVFPVKAVEDGK